MNNKKINWDELFMTMVYLIAMKSKDKNTHIGAVIIGPHKEVRSIGYNGLPRNVDDDQPERQERPEKYYWFEHAERNAIYNATLMGVSLRDCIIYTNGIPCSDCARGIIQSGIKKVIVDKDWNDNNSDKWIEHTKRSLLMFRETNVKIEYYTGRLLNITKFRNRKEMDIKGEKHD